MGCREEICELSTHRGAGTKSWVLVAKIRKKSKNWSVFVCDSSESGGMKRMEGWSQHKEGKKYMNPGEVQSERDSDKTDERRAYGGKETRHSVGVFLIC